MIEVNSAEAASGFGLLLTFSSGERRHFDMQPYLYFSVFRRLQNSGYFLLARVEYGTVVWPGEIDIAPETLYDRSVPLDDLYRGLGGGGQVSNGVVVWPNGLDLAPDTMTMYREIKRSPDRRYRLSR